MAKGIHKFLSLWCDCKSGYDYSKIVEQCSNFKALDSCHGLAGKPYGLFCGGIASVQLCTTRLCVKCTSSDILSAHSIQIAPLLFS